MKILCFRLVLFYTCFLILKSEASERIVPYDPTWESIDSRPLPSWYDEGKIGIFIHWGVYSVPSYINEWFWWSWKHDNSSAHDKYVKDNFKPGFRYEEFAPDFTAEFFDPNEWADLFQKAGAKYVVLTSKHHDGYALWPNSYGFAWNSVAVGPHRDLVGELATAVRQKTDVHFGLYYSLLEWFQPSYENDMANGWSTRVFPETKSIPTLKELVTKYEPEVIWSDGEWEAPDTYWDSVSFLAWLYNESPVKDTVVVNDRWGSETRGKHGGFYNFDDRYNPGVLIPHKWENAMTIDTAAWTYRREAKFQDFLSPEKLIATLVETVACGGNLLVNVGPTKEGTIPMIIQERLLQMGEWLGVNGEAIYNTVPYEFQNDTVTAGVWYTTNTQGSKVYAMTLNWPGSGKTLHLRNVEPITGMTIRMLGSFGNLSWSAATPSAGINVVMPLRDENLSSWAWTLAITFPAK
jgi:alpha-L-fucosidase